jgi:hypothetical protein
MPGAKVRATCAIALAIAPLALLTAACSNPPEQQMLTQFFRAARTRDNETVARMSAVNFDPRTQGEVVDFEITNVSEERRTPLEFKTLIDAERNASNAELEYRKKRLEWESNNRQALEAIAKMERDPKAKLSAPQQTMQAEWMKWRAEATTMQKATAAAKSALAAATGPAEASLSQPGQPPLAPDKFQGELLTKDVTLDAEVRAPDGQTSQKKLVVTIQRVAGTMDGTQRTGRPIITRIQGA